ncbi:MAG: protein kinase, partial [Rhodothermales bacterium]|nr:protein kinase [Rhodothermales bacterium]
MPWTQIERLFEAALGVPAAERGAWLDGHCADPALRREVAGLLAAHARTGVLDASLADLAAGAASAVGALPARVGPYRVVREVGRGGMGVVVEAHDPRLGRPVALKFLPPGASAEDDARFLTEARAASQLDHPHVGTVYDVGQTEDGRRWIAMAYYSGPSLAERIAEGPLPVEEAVRLAGEVADGLGAAHAAGLVHRDVKPANVVLTAQGTAKVLDFGVAKGAGEGQTRAGVRFGTLAYMAPEQVRADAVDARADLWALGVVLYELLTGRLPFDEEDPAALLLAILDREPPPVRALRPEVPEALERVVRQALAKDPARRFATAEAFATALRDAQAGAPARASSALPAPLTSFVGREVEVERLGRLLEAARLVTLTGPAGTGKTRLAVEAARRIEHGFADGAAFVPLAPVRDPALVPSALAQALGVEASGPALPDALADALRGCELLLVLDNFEQVTAAAPAVGALLGACPRLRVLATSRVPLRLSGEREAPVPPLAVPEPEATPDPDGLLAHAAVRLFVERAQAVDPAFALTPENAAAVAALCARLDGLPLAIELAAARTKLFAPAALLARLGHRLDLLANRMHDRPARHHTLRQALAWSYDLLGPEEQRLYRRLGVFRGGCTIEAAEAVAGLDGADDVLDGLAALVDHSLLRTTTGADGEPRFEMLETVRTFALERLAEAGERAEAQGAHAHHVLDLAERAAPELTGAEQGTWLDRLDAEHDNLRAALDAAEADGDTGLGLRLGTALWRFWLVRGHLAEGRRRLERLL